MFRFVARELLGMSTTGPSLASAAGHFSGNIFIFWMFVVEMALPYFSDNVDTDIIPRNQRINNMDSFFFRRSLQNNTSAKYICRRRSDCDINCKTRRNCQYCRLDSEFLSILSHVIICNLFLQIYEMPVDRDESKLCVDRGGKEEEVSQGRKGKERKKEPRSER